MFTSILLLIIMLGVGAVILCTSIGIRQLLDLNTACEHYSSMTDRQIADILRQYKPDSQALRFFEEVDG